MPEPMAAKLAGGPTVGELAREYLEDHVAVRYKPRSIPPTRTVVNRYIVPELGKLALMSVERAHVRDLHHHLHDKPYIANMVVGTLSLMYRLAEGWGMVPEGCNPCRSVAMYPVRKRKRFLTDTEFARLGKALDDVSIHGGASAPTVAALIGDRLLRRLIGLGRRLHTQPRQQVQLLGGVDVEALLRLLPEELALNHSSSCFSAA